MKRTGFKKLSFEEIKRRKQKQKDKNKLEKNRFKRYIKSLPKILEKISHDFVRKRDSISGEIKKGYCCCCKRMFEGSNFQAGHYIPSSTGGILLRYHPQNMHGQCAGCNMFYRQEEVKTQYADFMYSKYGAEKIKTFRQLQNTMGKKDKYFFETMISLYQEGDETEIINFLESYL